MTWTTEPEIILTDTGWLEMYNRTDQFGGPKIKVIELNDCRCGCGRKVDKKFHSVNCRNRFYK